MKQLLRILIGVLWWVGFSQAVYAHPNIDDDDRNPRSAKTGTSAKKEAALAAERRELHTLLKSLNYSFAESEMDVLPQPVLADATQESIKRAEEAFDKVRYIKELSVLNQELPMGVKEDLGNTTLRILSHSIIRYIIISKTIHIECLLALL